jgi:hypothetical protein
VAIISKLQTGLVDRVHGGLSYHLFSLHLRQPGLVADLLYLFEPVIPPGRRALFIPGLDLGQVYQTLVNKGGCID